MVEPNIIFQGGRLESGSDADVCRSWLFQDFEKQDLDIVAFHFPACYPSIPSWDSPPHKLKTWLFKFLMELQEQNKGKFWVKIKQETK